MKTRIGALFSIIAMLLITPLASAGDSPEAMIAAAKEVDRRFTQAFSKGDLAGIMANYWNSPSLVFYPPDTMEIHGYDAVKQAYKGMCDNIKELKLELVDPQYMVAGDMVIGWGKWKMALPGPDGKPAEMHGRYTEVLAKKAGKWVYIIDHPSMPLPAPGK
jgi:ketosteroid isomerase-like protein